MSDQAAERGSAPADVTLWWAGRYLWRLSAHLTPRHVEWLLRLRSGRALPRSLRARLLAMHLPPEAIDRVLGDVRRLADWLPAWNRAAQRFLSQARREEAAGRWQEAAVARRNAAMCYHVAHLITDDDPRTIRALRAAGVKAFEQAISRLLPETRKVTIAWRASALPAYIAQPPQYGDPAPLAVLLNGATTTKEELLLWSDRFLERGIAVLALDWPGTGETAHHFPLSSHCDDMTDGIIAFAESEAGLDASRIALVGFSVGGAVAVRAAALDRRIDACVAVTPPYDPQRWIGTASPVVLTHLRSLVGDRAALEELLDDFALPSVMRRLRCPLLVFGAGRDLVIPPDEALRLCAAAGELGTLVWYPRAGHGLYEEIDDWVEVTAVWLSNLFEGVPVASPTGASTRVDASEQLATTTTPEQ